MGSTLHTENKVDLLWEIVWNICGVEARWDCEKALFDIRLVHDMW
jgi:hypothetical protein